MKLSLDTDDAINFISSYQVNSVTVAQGQRKTALQHSILISAETLKPWTPQTLAELRAEHFNELINDPIGWQPQLILLGTGARQVFPAPELLRPLYEQGLGIEIMDTGAACRTYNIVVAEGRQVLAALLMIED